ncbi:MAG: endo-1,4-beta-xylanase [Verrucomicrobia bacterium]|nr:endo-1,4-beta-xylanase [Verrucomicrobiota bacterium]
MKSTSGTAVMLAANSTWGADSKELAPSDSELLAQARERIEKHRKGDGVVAVRGADGKSISNAVVKIEQLRHDFRFGCNFFMFGRVKDPQREELYRRRFAALLNYATLGFYWASYERERGQPIYDYTDQVAEWCREHAITCKGHPLVWDYADPRWLPQDFADIRALSNARVREIVARFKGRIDLWDVINEPTHLGRFKTRTGEWAMSMGAVPYTAEHLKIARLANPQATLLVNDYRTDPPYYKILDALREDGKLLFDAIGVQSHMHGGGWPLRRVWDVCDTYAKLGVPIHFTETTIVSGPRKGPGENWAETTPEGEAKQAEYVPKFYTMLFGHPSVEAATWWDFSDEGAWQRAAAGWVRKDMSPKPVYDRLMELVKGQWWTKAEGRTNMQGELPARAFFGVQRLRAETPDGRSAGKEVHWRRGGANRHELIVG